MAALKNLPFDSAFRSLSLWLDLLISVKDVSLFNFPQNTHVEEGICVNNTDQFAVS